MAKTFTNEKERSTRSHMNDPFARSDATSARRVLRDCHIAVQRYASASKRTDKRIAWVTVITLLRTVGHVLKNTDGARSPFLRLAIDEYWQKISLGGIEHEIFHDFIERERNNILKEYRIGEAAVQHVSFDTDHVDSMLVGSRLLPAKNVLHEALAWWETVLCRVEENAHQKLVQSRTQNRTRKKFRPTSKR